MVKGVALFLVLAGVATFIVQNAHNPGMVVGGLIGGAVLGGLVAVLG